VRILRIKMKGIRRMSGERRRKLKENVTG